VDDEPLIRFMRGVERDLGKLIEGNDNLQGHITAVSKKVDITNGRLDNHISDPAAHGIGAANEESKSNRASIGLIVSVTMAMIGIISFVLSVARLP